MTTREFELRKQLAKFDALPLQAKLKRDFALAAEDIRVLLATITTLRARVAELEKVVQQCRDIHGEDALRDRALAVIAGKPIALLDTLSAPARDFDPRARALLTPGKE